jgi:2-octaprenyl-6-methoxyphenol hydroxylase
LILERIDAFSTLVTTPITAIHVSQAGGFGRTLIRCEDDALPALGYVCDAQALSAKLLATAGERTLGRVTAWRPDSTRVHVTIDENGTQYEIATRLLVIADGGQYAGDDVALRDYDQSAIVARVRTEIVRRGTAFERFTANGPLALLPFAEDEIALIWTVRARDAAALVEQSGERFLAALGAEFGHRLGRFIQVGPRASIALKLWYRGSNTLAPRVIAIGNAAQTLHPVAGQGLNLGLRDAIELAAAARRTDRGALGDARFTDRYNSARRGDRRATIAATDSLVRIFSNESAWLRAARGAGLAALDLAPPARRLLARRMMLGLRGIP